MDAGYDILIVGGGLVGGTLAAALAGSPWRVGVIEAKPYGTPDQPSYDERSIALAFESRRIFEAIGLWGSLAQEAAPIIHIHVSDRGFFGTAHVDAREQAVPALGYVVPNRAVGAALMPALEEAVNIDLIAPATVESVENQPDRARVSLRQGKTRRELTCRVVIAADGTFSPLRKHLGIPARIEDYGQTALIANIDVDRPRPGIAWERFTDTGPLALLPLGGKHYSLVWTQRTADIKQTMLWSDKAFLEALQSRFGWRLGRFTAVGKRAAYPLLLVHAAMAYSGRTLLIGNALHSLHPVAGQGFNLALRDVAALIEILQDATDPGATPGLMKYQRLRQQDTHRVIGFTDRLARLFSRQAPLLGHLRGAGLLLADSLPPLNRLLAQQNMGLLGQKTHLGSGQPPQWK